MKVVKVSWYFEKYISQRDTYNQLMIRTIEMMDKPDYEYELTLVMPDAELYTRCIKKLNKEQVISWIEGMKEFMERINYIAAVFNGNDQ